MNTLVITTLKDLLKNLAISKDKYSISESKLSVITKLHSLLDKIENLKDLNGYVDISANSYLIGGALDYSSFTVASSYIEIYQGFIRYSNGECDDSSWEKIYSSLDTVERKNLAKRLKIWAEGFLLHIEENPKLSLIVIDKSNLH